MKSYTLVSGHAMPSVGLGTWQSEPGVVGQAVKDAILDVGYRHVDCAAIYGNEPEIGAAFADIFKDDGIKRDDVFITSKLWNTMHAPANVEPALTKTLKDLGLTYLDLYLIHWPVVIAEEKDADGNSQFISLEDMPIADTWKAMEACVDKGLVRDIGVSNFSVTKLKTLLKTARIKPAINQVERHPYLQNPELIEYCKENGILLTAYSPLGTAGTAMGNKSVPPILEDATLAEIAAKYGATPAQVLIAWAVACDTVVIPKSTKKHRLEENLASITKIKALDEDDMAKLAALDKHHRYVDGTFWCGEGSPYTLDNLWDENKDAGADEL